MAPGPQNGGAPSSQTAPLLAWFSSFLPGLQPSCQSNPRMFAEDKAGSTSVQTTS